MTARWLACALLCVVPWNASADDAEDAGGTDCFYQSQMRHYQVVDDQHITVEVSNNRYYLVELWRPVRNLDRSRRIAFRSPTNRVCSRFSEVLVDGDVRIRSIRAIGEAERDALLTQGERIEEQSIDGAEIEDMTGPGEAEDEDQQ